ncbi:ATPase involved in chromosome partitioning [Beggiatoa alba B18LD]|uniref:ATPase involved in chromosome partitioning n=1 Tax=Beggiatoa alba B18LD TaxID=395493 RepID=I3CJ15_9GAMM|nr:AAA family ATPase [Beggiatoa alba]EIJ43608.1 ATPase involved in chromosome partitioning [Beggiatoa alba B18LD]
MANHLIFDAKFCANEREVESKLIVSYLLPALGYQIDMWRQEKSFNRFRLDFLAFSNTHHENTTHSLIIEAKHPNKNLNECTQQLSDYMQDLNIQYGLLTNGREIRVYQTKNNIIHLIFTCYINQLSTQIDYLNTLIGKDALMRRYSLISSHTQGTQTMKIIAVYHNKGGVGKTTTVVNLAATFSKQGKRVLIVDLDSQANSTFATGLVNFGDEDKDTLKDSNIYHVLCHNDLFPIPQVARKSRFSSHPVDVIPSHIHLMKHENELNQIEHCKLTLSEKLTAVETQYDVVLIDTPPSLNLYARIALITSDYLLIPSDLKPFANEGLENVKELVKNINSYRKQFKRPPINILGVLPTKISTNAGFVKKTLQNRMNMVTERYGIEVLKDYVIFEREDLAKCLELTVDMGELEMTDPRAISDFKPNSKSVEEFEKLAQFITEKVGIA